jgi:hypothetical protein
MARTSPEPTAAPPAPAVLPGFRASVGQRAEIEVYGSKVSGVVVRAGAGSAVVDADCLCGITMMRLGVQAVATFGVAEGAARVRATVGRAREGISLQFTGPAQLINRRAHPRVDLGVPVDIVWTAPGRPGMVASAESVDLSAGGIRLRVKPGQELPVEHQLTLLTLNVEGRSLTLPARILAVHGGTLRAQFSGPAPEDVEAISAIVLHHLVAAAAVPAVPARAPAGVSSRSPVRALPRAPARTPVRASAGR